MKRTARDVRNSKDPPIKVPTCATCKQPLVRCACKNNTLKK